LNIDFISVWWLFAATIVVVILSIEIGYRLGSAALRRSPDEKESPVSAMTGAVLGLTAFVLAFTFGIVSDRYDYRKALVRDEANAIGTAMLRTDFLPEPDRSEALALFKEYLNLRLELAQSGDLEKEHVEQVLSETQRIQNQLWSLAVTNGRKDMNSPVIALYIDSLNTVIDIHALRVAVGLQTRVPIGIWAVLYSITILGMMGVGYQTGIAGSKRSMARPILAVAFSLVFMLIASLDRPNGSFINVTQQPLIDLRDSMDINAHKKSP
jgi:hypothetical protein